MTDIDYIGFEEEYINAKLAGKVFKITLDPSTENYWKIVTSIRKSEKGSLSADELKRFIINFIVESHYSLRSRIFFLGKIFCRGFLYKRMGIISLSTFIVQYTKVLNERGVLKNVVSPQGKKGTKKK